MFYDTPGAPHALRLKVRACGREDCAPGHRFGPAVREYFLLHVVSGGRGEFVSGAGRFSLGPGEGFLIFPGEVTVYTADAQDPWRYAWVGFSGEGADALLESLGLSRARPVLRLGESLPGALSILYALYEDAVGLRMGELAAVGGLYRLLALLGQGAQAALPSGSLCEQYYRKAVWMMESGMGQPLRVQEIARAMGLSRSQLFRVFKQVCGRSPQQVLLEKRLSQARRLLEETSLSIAEVAEASGFSGAVHLTDALRAAGFPPPGKLRRAGSGPAGGRIHYE
ncbi:AraC family ligand binding domain-containing protein [Beduinella massiliensis]|uniref:AraC family ligand binding domain-containing protein n=1 Tax=Beduinella massiliensis TaxID=1852363 RepID=UPI000C860FFE